MKGLETSQESLRRTQLARSGGQFIYGHDIKGFQQMLRDSGAWRVDEIKGRSAVENFTTALKKQDLTLKDVWQNRKLANQALKEQWRLHNSMAVGWTENGKGEISADMIIPRDAPERLNSFRDILGSASKGQSTWNDAILESRMRLGMMSEMTKSAGLNLVNLGKNTQWAGRQMMVGIGVPFAALAAGAGKLAYDVDKEMTRILKVYDYTNETMNGIDQEREAVRANSMQTANSMARQYGASMTDTLQIQAELAATGQQGVALQQAAAEVTRASFLGELDRQDAIQTTITLQTVLGQNTRELGESFDYLNGLENATSLSMKDMSIAIPKVAGVMKAMMGPGAASADVLKNIGTMMTALKAGGVSAAEGANTLKTVLFRANAPFGQGKETFFKHTGKDVKELVASTKGDAVAAMTLVGKAIEDIPNAQDKIETLRTLFGVHQGSKAGIFLQQLATNSEQVTRAMEVAALSVADLRMMADKETQAMQRSVSGRFKIAVETIKAELAELGEPFLKAATTIIGGITKIISAFNGLNDGLKNKILIGATLIALIGPVVMITGVFLNLLGTVVKAGGSLMGLMARFKSLSREEKAAALLAEQTTLKFGDQALAAEKLAIAIGQTNHNMARMLTIQAALAAGKPITPAMLVGTGAAPKRTGKGTEEVGGIRQTMFGTTQDMKTGRTITDKKDPRISNARLVAQEEANILNKTRGVAVESEKVTRKWVSTLGAMSGSAGMLLMMAGGTSEFANKASLALMSFTLMGPIMRGIVAALKKSVLASAAMTASGLAGARAAAGARTAFAAMKPALGPIGLALAAVGVSIGLIVAGTRSAKKEFDDLNNAGRNFAETMGVAALETQKFIDPDTGKSTNVQTVSALADKMREEQKGTVEQLESLGKDFEKNGNKTALAQTAQKIGLDVYQLTGDAKAAKQAIEAALNIADTDMATLGIKIDFEDKNWVNTLTRETAEGLATAAAKNKGKKQGLWDDLKSLDLGMNDDVKSRIQAQALVLGETFKQAAAGSIEWSEFETQWKTSADAFINQGVSALKGAFDKGFTKGELKVFETLELPVPKTVEEFATLIMTNEQAFRAFSRSTGLVSGSLAKAVQSTGKAGEGFRLLSREANDAAGTTNIAGVQANNMNTTLTATGTAGWRAANGAKAAAAGAGELTDEANEAEGAVEGLNMKLSSVQSAAQGAWSNAWGLILDNIAQQAEDNQEASMDRLKSGHESELDKIEADADAAEKAFDARAERAKENDERQDEEREKAAEDRKKAEEAAYDGRIAALEAAIDAEEAAEQTRQKIFEAEKRRVQRLADLYNQNIDFNVALSTGDLDEAARVGNNIRATADSWRMEDAAGGSQTASEQRISALQGQIDTVEGEKEARLEAIATIEEAEDKARERERERRDKALEEERERYKAGVESHKESVQARQEADEKAAQKRYDIQKRSLDMALAAEREFTPQNLQQIQDRLVMVEGKYADHGRIVETKGKEWATFMNEAIGTSMDTAKQSLQTDIDWFHFGEKAARDFITGAFGGKSVEDFLAMANTGPTGPMKPEYGGYKANTATPLTIGPGFTNHEGGRVGMQGARTGYPLSAKRFPSEVDTRLKVGEFVVKKKAVDALGIPFMNAVNEGDPSIARHAGGIISPPETGFMGAFANGMSAVMKGLIYQAVKGQYDMGAALSGGEFSSGGQWPPAQKGVVSPNTRAAANYIRERWGLSNIGLLGQRKNKSDHPFGKALDAMIPDYKSPQGIAMGNAIASFFVENPDAFGTKYVIWRQMINSGKGWRAMEDRGTDTANHMDHPHVSFKHLGGLMAPMEEIRKEGIPPNSFMPQMRNGGHTFSEGLANLHPRETVLSAPLSQQFEQGVQNFANGGGNEYNVKMDFSGATIDSAFDMTEFERAFNRVIEKKEGKVGRRRVIN